MGQVGEISGTLTVTMLLSAFEGRLRGVPRSWPRTNEAACSRWAGSSGAEPRGVAKTQAASMTTRIANAPNQHRSKGLCRLPDPCGGRGPVLGPEHAGSEDRRMNVAPAPATLLAVPGPAPSMTLGPDGLERLGHDGSRRYWSWPPRALSQASLIRRP